MTPGDVYWVRLGSRGGRAQAGRRPGIIFQKAEVTRLLPTVLVIPLTTQTEALRFPGTVLVEPDRSNGLRKPSVALVFQMTAVDQRALEDQLGQLSSKDSVEITQALETLLPQD